MLVIRLTRKGKKNQPFFRVVVVDKRRSAKGGRAVEVLGYVDPLTKRKSLKKERVLYWISKGAQPSVTMHNLLVSEKVINAPKINKFKKPARSASSTADAGGSNTAKAAETPKTVTPEAAKETSPETKVVAEKPAIEATPAAPVEAPTAAAEALSSDTQVVEDKKPKRKAAVEAPKTEEKPAEKTETPKA
ncbi:MAG: 30S ribosomal protein S16 [Patescibacteria group bacterium]